ncbi:LOW QUALITY PROTEIN: telomere-associated protein RIF1 [Pholidichthys leucotaenia]
MMATAGPPSTSSLAHLLETLEDSSAGQSEQTDAYLTIASRLGGEDGRKFLPTVEKHFSRLGKTILAHINSPNTELSQAALQALGFCVYHSHVVSGLPGTSASEILTALCSLVMKSTDKNTCTRALWVISKQSFPADVVTEKVPCILATLESVWKREDVQSVVMEHEALNVVIRLVEQVPTQMSKEAVQWAKLIVPLVVHSAAKVRLRAAAAMELGMPLLLEKQADVAAVIEPMMSSKLIPELQKLFVSKNETNVLKLWPLFVRLLGKLLHKGGPFINSLLHLEELGFRSSSPTIKKIAFLAWKSLIDNFALTPEILCSSKRMKLLMQPLTSIHVRTEALLLTKVEVWWYLVVQLGPNLSANFDQVAVPLLQSTIGSDSPLNQSNFLIPGTPKSGGAPNFSSPANTSRMSLNCSVQLPSVLPAIQLLGLEMLFHYLLGPEAVTTGAKNKLVLSLEPLKQPLLSSMSSFTKHAAVLISNIRDSFINIGKEAPESLLTTIWTSLVRFVSGTIESGSKKERQGSEVLTLTLQTLQSVVSSEALPADRVLVLFEATLEAIPHRVLGSASYQVGKMDVLNGTPALFLILLLYNSSMLSAYMEDERFYQCLQTLVTCGLSGPTSSLAFAEAVLGAVGRSAASIHNKEQLLRKWSMVVGPLTDTITQSNEVNQGDALEHNFSAVHSALMLPVTHLLQAPPLPQASQKSMLSSWSKLYRVFARCSALVTTAEENVCCEELCARMSAAVDREALMVPSTLNAVSILLQVMVECVDFSPYTPQFTQKMKSPHTPVNWMKKRTKSLGNLSTLHSLLVQCVEAYLDAPDCPSEMTGLALMSVLSIIFTNLVLANSFRAALTPLIQPLCLLYQRAAAEPLKFSDQLTGKLEKLVADILGGPQTRSTLAYDNDLLALLSPLLCVLFPHRNKHVRTAITHFWNTTFANAVSLTYSDEIRPVLSQVKHSTPIILPGFEVVTVPDNHSGSQFSSEGSELDTKLSGIPVSSVGKRESLLCRAVEPKDRNSTHTPKPVSTKLDFGSPRRPPHREALEEEASIDFVFIPPETKERVLTEHQKEVKRTKRVDIPTMYNNLDASLDTTVFNQFTQSQEDSLDKQPSEQPDSFTSEDPGEVMDHKESQRRSTTIPQRSKENEKAAETVTETVDYASTKEAEKIPINHQEEEVLPELADVSMEEQTKEIPVNHQEEEILPELADVSMEEQTKEIPVNHQEEEVLPELADVSMEDQTKEIPVNHQEEEVLPELADVSVAVQIKEIPVNHQEEEVLPESADVSMEAQTKDDNRAEEGNVVLEKTTSPNMSESPDLVSGNSQKPSSRRQAFITLEKYTEGKSPSSSCMSSFTGPLVKTSNSQEHPNANDVSSPQDSVQMGQVSSQCAISETPESPRRPRDSRTKTEPIKLIDRMSSDTTEDEDVIPDTQTEAQRIERTKTDSTSAEVEPSSKEQESDMPLDSSQSSPTQMSPNELRRSGRQRVRPLLPGEDPEEREAKYTQYKKRRSEGEPKGDSPSSELAQSRPNTRAKQAAEENSGRDRLRSRTQKDSLGSNSAHRKTKLFNITSNFLDKPDRRRKSAGERESDSQSDQESQSQGRRGRLKKVQNKEGESSQMATPKHVEQTDSQITIDKSQQVELVEKVETDEDKRNDSEILVASMQTGVQPEESELVEGSNKNSQMDASSPTKQQSQTEASILNEEDIKDDQKMKQDTDDNLSQEDSEANTPLSHGQAKRRGRRKKVSSEVVESKDKTENTNSLGRQSRSSSHASQEETLIEGRTRRSKGQDKLPKSTPESSQSLDVFESESSQGRGRYSKRQSTPAAMGPMESLESESSEVKEATVVPKRRGRKPRASLQSPLALQPKEDETVDGGASQNTQGINSSKTQELQDSESLQVTESREVQSQEKSPVEMEADGGQSTEQEDGDFKTNTGIMPLQETVFGNSEVLDPVELRNEESLHGTSLDTSVELPEVSEAEGEVSEKQKVDLDSDHQEPSIVPQEELQEDHQNIADEEEEGKEEILNQDIDNTTEEDIDVLVDQGNTSHGDFFINRDDKPIAASELVGDGDFQRSPVKQKEVEAVAATDVIQSPSNGQTKGTWSPLASPSTSILKKAQKRSLEVETPSPVVKSRRVSFANPIQQQETADDIDRRSPAVRTSSPRRSRVNSLPQPKHITTPTKPLMVPSPRTPHSPGYKSSKKCLISEMSQEPRPVSKDCIYPALVGCCAPVEAVLPQISSNMWPRGFGQLIRAKNIKTVGDLCALTPADIKALPIRSPKVSNVKKALQIYEQQRKGRGGDELKSFDETEMMTSEPEENAAPQILEEEEEEKSSTEMLATELVDEPTRADVGPEQGASADQYHVALDHRAPAQLSSDVEVLSHRMTPLELSRCPPPQLIHIYDELGAMMRRVVVELQRRLSQTEDGC